MNNKKGFTLIEMIAVIAIVTLLLSIILINCNSWWRFVHKQNLQIQAREILQLLIVNKNNAMIDGCTRKVYFYKDKIYVQTIADSIITEIIVFKDDIKITSNTYYGKNLAFKPIGTVNQGGHITFENKNGEKITIVLQIGSGRIYLKEGGA